MQVSDLTPSEPPSEGKEGQAGEEGQREEYFGEPRPTPVRRSSRIAPRETNEEEATNLPPPNLDAAWIKLQEGVAMRVWHVQQGRHEAYYGVDGSKVEATRQELSRIEVPDAYAKRHWANSLTVPNSMHRAILLKLATAARTTPLPTQAQWEDWLRPISSTMHIEFLCRLCGMLCKTFNRYAEWVDSAEHYGRATCHLFGRRCGQGDMGIPESLRADMLEDLKPLSMNMVTAPSLQTVPKTTTPLEEGLLPQATTSLDEGMLTAREPKEDEKEAKNVVPPLRKQRIRRKKGHTRFTAISRPARTRKQTSTSRVMETKSPSQSSISVTAPMIDKLRWDDDVSQSGEGTVSQITPTSPRHTTYDSMRHELNELKETMRLEVNQQMHSISGEIAILRQMMQTQHNRPPQHPKIEEITDEKNEMPSTSHAIFSTTELEELHAQTESDTKQLHEVVERAEKWVRDLRADKIKPMAKAMGKVVAASSYAGEPQPITFAAWCDSLRALMAMYDIPPGSSQVQVATWFITGPVKTWWEGLCASKRYGDLATLSEFLEAVRAQFQPQDAAEQCIDKWCSLKQTQTVTIYMNEVDALHNTWRLCEKAEFGLAMRGLKKELKGVIRRAMNDQKVRWISLKDLRALAISAEIEKFDPSPHRPSMFNTPSRMYMKPYTRITPQPKYPALTMGALELKHPRHNETSPNNTHNRPITTVYRCGICGMKNHLTTLCIHRKKEGCWRCGGKHMLKDCRAPFARNANPVPPKMHNNKDDDARNAVLGAVMQTPQYNNTIDLAYPVRVNASPTIAIATLDTGAQCSVIRKDVAQAAGVDWTPYEDAGLLRGVSGEPLNVFGKSRLCIQAGGLTFALDAWVVDGVRPQIILGLPWIQQVQPQVDWNDSAALVFPNGGRWKTGERTEDLVMQQGESQEALVDIVQAQEQGNASNNNDTEPNITAASWLQSTLDKYSHLFTPLSGIPPDERVRHAIHLSPGARPVMKRPYRLAEAQKRDANEQIRNAMKEGWIQPSSSAWGTAILMVPKKDGTWRMCVDYRDLNALTISDAYPLPRIDDLLHRLGTAKYFSKLDLQSGYHQIWIDPEDRPKTAFRIGEPVDGHCHFEWRVMPFGLKNAPPTFQRYMTLVMTHCADCCLVYMDDLLVFSTSLDEHIQHVTRVFAALEKAQLKVKLSKCVFGVTSVDFLGHTISQGLIEMDDTKKQAILRWKPPLTSAKEVRQFMGMVSYYRNFVPRLSTLAEPLTRLTRKRTSLEWGWEAEQAMENIKDAIIHAQSLMVWDPQLHTRITTDASNVGMGAIIEQLHDENKWQIVSSWSRKLTPCQQRYSTTDREWLAAVECITRVWKHWLLGKDFELRTDHAALKEVLTKKGEEFTYRQLRWYERLEPYTFTVTYIKGKDNVVSDALSRTPEFYETKAIHLMPPSPHAVVDMDELREAAHNDVKYSNLCKDAVLCNKLKLVCNTSGLLETTCKQVCVPMNDVLRYKLVLEAHEPVFSGHFSERKTLEKVKRHWWWPHMYNTVQRVVSCCPICQCDATKKQRDEGPYKPLVSGAPWEVITVDFVSGFTPSLRNRHTACCVVCDRFTRMIHLESCRDHATAREAVGMMLRMVISRHGCPRVIISDRGTQFDSDLWTHVWRMMGTRVAMASTHHPQTNGLTERCNRTLISLIRKYVHAHPGHWAEYLPLFEFAYNNTVHSTINVAPFVADKGYNPPTPVSLLNTEWNVLMPTQEHVHAHVAKLKQAMIHIWKLVAYHEQKAQQQITNREQRVRGNIRYHEGDEVLVYWPPFRSYTDVVRKQRLRYIGPFKVLRVVNDNAVVLEGLPERMPKTINTEYIHLYKRDDDERLANLRQSPQPPHPNDQ